MFAFRRHFACWVFVHLIRAPYVLPDECQSVSVDYKATGMVGCVFTCVRVAYSIAIRIESACSECLSRPGCGFCMSTGECLNGSDHGQAQQPQCPFWLASGALCPIEPTCDDYVNCGHCVEDQSCAWYVFAWCWNR